MRKTSHDGTDVTSITSGIENELKKAGTSISKIKKSSIKRKVQNFSHESDDGIIEPLLQIDKEKSEIANRSAKYLLNKSKTEFSERGNKSSENYAEKNSISSPVCSTSKIATSTENENQMSTSYIYGKASIHNHMNTNVFGTYDASQGVTTTKNPILVEIDANKPGGYPNPSPLIFTTAKIHTDSKTKLMEPVHVTPMPILSTIEGSVVKTVPSNAEIPLIKNICGANQLSPIKSKPFVSTTVNTVSSNAEVFFSKGTSCSFEGGDKNKKEAQKVDSTKDPSEIYSINQNMSQFSNSSSKGISSPTTGASVNIKSKTSKDELCKSPTIIYTNNDSITVKMETSIVTPKTGNGTNLSQKLISPDKPRNVIYVGESKDLSTIVQLPVDLQKADIKTKNIKSPKEASDSRIDNVTLASKASTVFSSEKKEVLKSPEICDSRDNISQSKISYSGSKKLQRQKNAAIEDATDTNNINVLPKDELSKTAVEKKEIVSLKTIDSKIDKDVTTTFKATTVPISNPIVATTSIPQSTSKIKSPMGTINLQALGSSEDVLKVQNKTIVSPVSKDKHNVASVTTSVFNDKKNSGAMSMMATSSNIDSVPPTSKSSKSDVAVKSESSVVATTLPSYIVSTSKTKIGSTLTSNTVTSTTKTQLQKPSSAAVYTPNETVKLATAAQPGDRPTVGTSTSNGTKHSIFSQQTKSNVDTFKKDGRA